MSDTERGELSDLLLIHQPFTEKETSDCDDCKQWPYRSELDDADHAAAEILKSDWLKARDERVRAEERERIAGSLDEVAQLFRTEGDNPSAIDFEEAARIARTGGQ